ncbi:hypothetical protein CAEBREN_06762 [Caenorhabditis brenneri]|uniref:Uncharacterized protein n=1 Tax=Caenorhabditis brenneri TaxID=135651 RepID=G0M856_CAEBE|nr:hypothetical protein CAEBREN_06762 [Caenorhabditis brenneri]
MRYCEDSRENEGKRRKIGRSRVGQPPPSLNLR